MNNSNWPEINAVLIEGLKAVKEWCEDKTQSPLISIFDLISFQERILHTLPHYWLPLPPLTPISEDTLPFPTTKMPLEEHTKQLKRFINQKFKGLSDEYLRDKTTLQLLLLLENLGTHLPAKGYDNKVSIYDAYKVKAIETWLALHDTPEAALIYGDISGIQNFIFTIASENALRNLRARSFFINLLEEHIIHKCLTALGLPSSNVLFSGGGSFALISHWDKKVSEALREIKFSINNWLLNNLESKLYVAIVSIDFSASDLKKNFLEVVKTATYKLFKKKRNKFKEIIEKGIFPFVSDKDPLPDGCNICHKDDGKLIKENENLLCPLCHQLTKIGQQLPKKEFIGVSKDIPAGQNNFLKIEDTYYLLPDTPQEASWCIYKGSGSFFTALQHKMPLFYGDMYVTRISDLPPALLKEIKEELSKKLEAAADEEEKKEIRGELEALKEKDSMASLNYLARIAHGTELIGSLKMDVDNVGLILQRALSVDFYLKHLIAFSRHIRYFFKVYVNRLCERKQAFYQKTSFLDDEESSARYVSIVYAGGDDLFVLGSWDAVSRLSIDLGSAFKEYTCSNPDLGISAGVTLHHPKVPVYQMVQSADKALSIAKKSLEPCWQCHQDWPDCPLLSNEGCKRKGALCLFYNSYLYAKYLQLKQTAPRYESMDRLNLVVRWQAYDRGRIVNEVEDYILKPLKQILPAFKKENVPAGIVYRLLGLIDTWHESGKLYLPKLVWVMAKFKEKLKRAKTEDKESLYTVLDEQFHYFNPDRLSCLHMPLMWTALWLRGGKDG